MTVPIEASRVEYAGNGVTTAFPTTFYFQASSQVRVRTTPSGGVATVLTEGVHYTVTTPARGSGAGGTVTFLTAPASGTAIAIERDVLFVQETALRTAGQFEPETHEDIADYQMMALQEVVRDMADLELASGSATIAAGSGLTSTGTSPVTLHVGAGDGITVNADNIEVDYGIGPDLDLVYADSATALEGINPKAARIDHRHVALTGTPGAIAIGDAADDGSEFALARADHQHSLAAPGAPADVTKATAAPGVSPAPSRADHKHDIATAAAVTLTDSTNAEGNATSLARSNHTHAHGNRGGGTLHAVATTSVAGFMSSADKTKLDSLASETVTAGSAKTTDATPTNILQWTPTNQTGEAVELVVCAKRSAAAEGGAYGKAFCVVRFDNVTSQVGTTQNRWTDIESSAGMDVAVIISSPNVIVRVTGIAAQTIDWYAVARRFVAPGP
jgi:hypothetical protein